jgi:azurin
MSDQEDEVFVRNFSLVLAGLVVIGLGAYVLAIMVNSNFEKTQGYNTTLAERVQPVGAINTSDEVIVLNNTNQKSVTSPTRSNTNSSASSPLVAVGKCEAIINATDTMQYDVTELKVDSSCPELKLTLNHTGNLPANIMGHNVVFVAETNFDSLISTIDMANGAEKGYLPDSQLILGQTAIIGGGESSSIILDLSLFKSGESYTFFCSFPGHYSMMKGTLTI